MPQIIKQTIINALVLLSLCLAPLAYAEYVAIEKAAEADHVRVVFSDKDKQTGTLYVKGCGVCPLTLEIDEQTYFFYNNEEIQRKGLGAWSGKSGTVIYSLDDQQAKRILW